MFYFILGAPTFERNVLTFKNFTCLLLKNVLNIACTFLMKLFPSKFSCLFLRLFNNQNWLESMKSNITKTICFLKKTYTHFFYGYVKEHIFKIMKQNLITFLSWSSWKSGAYFLNIFWTKFGQCHWIWVLIFIWNESLIILYLFDIFNFYI